MSKFVPLIFKSNDAAFAYACENLDNSLENEHPVLGYVLAVEGNQHIVKFANSSEPTIPTESTEKLLAAPNLATIAYSAVTVDGVPRLQPGDLVMIQANPHVLAIGKPGLVALIVAKVKPIYLMDQGGWQISP